MRRIFILGSLLVALAILAASRGITEAQYPEPIGSITVTVTNSAPPTGSTVTVTCEVRDAAGRPMVGVACTMTIQVEPGNDAALGSKSVTLQTNAQGRASTNLYVGSSPGIVVIHAEAGGMRSAVLVNVVGQAPLPAAPAALPPAAPVEVAPSIVPPATGSGGLR